MPVMPMSAPANHSMPSAKRWPLLTSRWSGMWIHLAMNRYGKNSIIHFLSSESQRSNRFLKMCATPFGASRALISGTATNTTPMMRCDMRMANTVSAPTAAARAGTNTNRPEMHSRMHAAMVMPCVKRACSEWRLM